MTKMPDKLLIAQMVGQDRLFAGSSHAEDLEEVKALYPETHFEEYVKSCSAHVKVKPLVWSGLRATSIIGEYILFPTFNRKNERYDVMFVNAFRKSTALGCYDGEDISKGVAQEDYVRRIRGTLVGT
mgnify:CR=1 FL=1